MAFALTPVGAGIKAQNAAGAVEVTLAQVVPAGKLLILAAYATSVVTLTGVTDDNSNSYSALSASTSAQGNGYWVHARVTTGLASGDKIYAAFSGAVSRRLVVAIMVDGAAASYIDAQGSSAQIGSNAAPIVNTGPQADAGELVLTWLFATSPLVTITEDGLWATLGEAVAENRKLHVAGREMASTAADTYQPGFNSSRDWSANWLAIKASGSTVRTLAAASGVMVLTGRAARLPSARNLADGVRSYTVAGINTAIRRGYRILADVRGYAHLMAAAGLKRGLRLVGANAAHLLSGVVANVARTNAGRTLSAATASISLTCRAAKVRANRKLRVSVDGRMWARLAAGLFWSRRTFAAPSAYVIASGALAWGWTHILKSAPGSIAFSGQAAAATYSGELGWQSLPPTPATWAAKPGTPEMWTSVDDIPEIWS